jgi:hypothetical protein
MKYFFLLLIPLWILSSCSSSSSTISLSYQPKPNLAQGVPIFAQGDFLDKRNSSPLYLGTIRTQIGTPLEHLNTRFPVSQIVSNAFGHALASRGMLSPVQNAKFIFVGDILDLNTKLLVTPYAYARIRVNLIQAGTGQILASRTYTSEKQGSPYLPGSGSPVPILNNLCSAALQDVIDRAVDDPFFRTKTTDSTFIQPSPISPPPLSPSPLSPPQIKPNLDDNVF